MIWAILILLGVPLWLCAIGIFIVAFRSRRLRGRYGNIPVRVLRPGRTRWTRGQAIWVSDVFAWRGNPAAWAEDLVHVVDAAPRPATSAELKKLHRLGEGPAVVELTGADRETVTVATTGATAAALLGPFTHDPTIVANPATHTASDNA